MRIHKPEIVRKGLETAYQVSVDSILGERTLWFRVPREHEELLTRSCNPALVGLLLPAMAAGEDIVVDGPVSEKLWFNLSGPLQHLLKHNAPYLQHIKIIADSADNQVGNLGGVATGLSGGVDSFFTLKTYAGEEVTPGFRLTHLFVNNVGSPDGGIMFRERFERLKPVAEKLIYRSCRLTQISTIFIVTFGSGIRFLLEMWLLHKFLKMESLVTCVRQGNTIPT